MKFGLVSYNHDPCFTWGGFFVFFLLFFSVSFACHKVLLIPLFFGFFFSTVWYCWFFKGKDVSPCKNEHVPLKNRKIVVGRQGFPYEMAPFLLLSVWNGPVFRGHLFVFGGGIAWYAKTKLQKNLRIWWKAALDLEGASWLEYHFFRVTCTSYCWWLKNSAPVEVGSLSHYLQGFKHPRWCSISSMNSMRISNIYV